MSKEKAAVLEQSGPTPGATCLLRMMCVDSLKAGFALFYGWSLELGLCCAWSGENKLQNRGVPKRIEANNSHLPERTFRIT